MAAIDIIVPTSRGVVSQSFANLQHMMRHTMCMCGGHVPWKCPKGKHSVRLVDYGFHSTVVHWARNQVVAMGLYGKQQDPQRPLAEYFLLMDDDMTPMPGDLARLVSHRVDIVAGICTVRRDPPRPNIRFFSPEAHGFVTPFEWDFNSPKLIELDAVGSAFMLVKREVFERMGRAYVDCMFERYFDKRRFPGRLQENASEIDAYWDEESKRREARLQDEFAAGNWQGCDQWWFQFLANAVPQQVGELGEDISFCWKAKMLGFKVYADPQVTPGHLGEYAYSVTDYVDWVRAQKETGNAPENQPPNVSALKEVEELGPLAVR